MATRAVMWAGGLSPIVFALAARDDRRPKPRSSGAPAARHGVRALPPPNSPECEAEEAELHSGGSTSTGETRSKPRHSGARDAGSPACLVVTSNIRVLSTFLHTEPERVRRARIPRRPRNTRAAITGKNLTRDLDRRQHSRLPKFRTREILCVLANELWRLVCQHSFPNFSICTRPAERLGKNFWRTGTKRFTREFMQIRASKLECLGGLSAP